MLQNYSQELVTIDDLCQSLNIGKNTAYSLLNSGELQGAFRIGRIWKIPKDVLINYISRKSQADGLSFQTLK